MRAAPLRRSLGDEAGWTLIELMVVVGILGVLSAIAIPVYLGYERHASDSVAAANLRAALPDAEAYYVDHQTYVGLDDPTTGLRKYDQGLSSEVRVNASADLTATHYCLTAIDHGQTYWVRGPGGTITAAKPAGCA